MCLFFSVCCSCSDDMTGYEYVEDADERSGRKEVMQKYEDNLMVSVLAVCVLCALCINFSDIVYICFIYIFDM